MINEIMIDMRKLIEMDETHRIKIIALLDSNDLKENMSDKFPDAGNLEDLIKQISNYIMMNFNRDVVIIIEGMLKELLIKEKNNIEDFIMAINSENLDDIRSYLLKILTRIPFKDYDTLNYVFRLELRDEDLGLINLITSMIESFTDNNNSVRNEDETAEEINNKYKTNDLEEMHLMYENAAKKYEKEIEVLEKECEGKERAIENLIYELKAYKKQFEEDRELNERLEKGKKELDGVRNRMLELEDVISNKKQERDLLDEEYDLLWSKKLALDSVLDSYFENLDLKVLESKLNSFISKHLVSEKTNGNVHIEEAIISNEETIIFSEYQTAENLIEYISINIQSVGLDEQHTKDISEYILMNLINKSALFVIGFESLEISKRVAYSYSGNNSSVVHIKKNINNVDDIISILDKSSSSLIIFDGLVENIDHELLSLLPRYAREKDKILIINTDNNEILRFLGPNIINNYALIIPSVYDIETKTDDYEKYNMREPINGIIKESLKYIKENVIDDALGELTNIPESYKMSRNIVLNSKLIYDDEEKFCYERAFEILFESELRELLKIRGREDILDEIRKCINVRVHKKQFNGEFF